MARATGCSRCGFRVGRGKHRAIVARRCLWWLLLRPKLGGGRGRRRSRKHGGGRSGTGKARIQIGRAQLWRQCRGRRHGLLLLLLLQLPLNESALPRGLDLVVFFVRVFVPPGLPVVDLLLLLPLLLLLLLLLVPPVLVLPLSPIGAGRRALADPPGTDPVHGRSDVEVSHAVHDGRTGALSRPCFFWGLVLLLLLRITVLLLLLLLLVCE